MGRGLEGGAWGGALRGAGTLGLCRCILSYQVTKRCM